MSLQIQLLIDALTRANISDGEPVESVAAKIVNHLNPKLREVERSETKVVVDVTSSVDAGIFCALTTGNPKIADYAFPDGKQSGLVRFGQCDRLVADVLGETLISVVEIAFTRQVPVGDTVRLTIERGAAVPNEKLRGFVTKNTITGVLLPSGKPMMRPSTVITHRPFECPTR
tara:strand:- start:4460 stop:4978 length:519 start_codon:yes stop_codon:yes gene_type:complete